VAADALTPELVTPLLQARLDDRLRCTAVSGGVLGNGQETWFVDAEAPGGAIRKLVIRRSAAGGTQEDTDRSLEFALLDLLRARDFPVPAVHWVETEPSALERPYFVMDRLAGRAPGRTTPEERRAIAGQIGTWLARLHAVEPAAAPPQLPRHQDTAAATRAELARWRDRYLEVRPGPVPLLGALLAWLEAEVPAAPLPERLLWGDPGPHNVLVEGDRVTAILDWEQAHLGHPLEDLGYAVWACLETYDAADVVAAYEAEAGPVDRGALAYYVAFANVVRAIMVVAGVGAFLADSPRPSLAGLGQYLLLDGLARAADAAGWGSPGPPEALPWPLRPDVHELVAGVARFLRSDVVPAVDDWRLTSQLKTAAALLETVAVRAPAEDEAGAAELEERAARAERERSPDREGLRAALLADLAAKRALIGPLDRLYGVRA
jgi:aminoglycoside phosphotransferase (APT) family kinase protein